MSLTKYPLDEETQEFFNRWAEKVLFSPILFKCPATEVIEKIMPAIDGTLEIFFKDGKHCPAKVKDYKIILKTHVSGWTHLFSIEKPPC